MSALSRIEKAGFKISLAGDALKVSPFSKLTIQQREFLKSHKAEIIEELQNRVEWVDLPEPAPNAIMVICYTPAGNKIDVVARDEDHTEFLRRWNPQYQPN